MIDMKMCEYLDNLTEILTLNSMIIEQEPIDIKKPSERMFSYIFLRGITLYLNSGTVIFAYMKMKPTRSKYAYLRMDIYSRNATILEINHIAELEIIGNTFIKIVEG